MIRTVVILLETSNYALSFSSPSHGKFFVDGAANVTRRLN
jgi:hypothetical protein